MRLIASGNAPEPDNGRGLARKGPGQLYVAHVVALRGGVAEQQLAGGEPAPVVAADCRVVVAQQLESISNVNCEQSEESILLSHMGPPKSAIKSLILVVEKFCVKHFFILFQF